MKKQETFEDAIPKPNNIYFKLWKAKQEIQSIKKNAKNPHFKNTYADINATIEAVEPILHKYNLILLQPIENGDVVSRIIDAENGDTVESRLTLPSIQDPQKVGSAVTYFRRYTLQSLLSLQAEDDDGSSASQSIKSKPKLFPQDRFENGLTKVTKGELDKDTFLGALKGFDLTEVQKQALLLI